MNVSSWWYTQTLHAKSNRDCKLHPLWDRIIEGNNTKSLIISPVSTITLVLSNETRDRDLQRRREPRRLSNNRFSGKKKGGRGGHGRRAGQIDYLLKLSCEGTVSVDLKFAVYTATTFEVINYILQQTTQ